MIGNDLIDLEQAAKNSRLQNSRFRKKVFSDRENIIIHNSENAEKSFWLLWSMKEAAYKAHQRQTNSAPTLNPLQFKCFPSEDQKSGKVITFGNEYFIKSRIAENYLFTIASAEKNLKVLQKNYPKNGNYKAAFSAHVSEYLKLKNILSLEKNQYRIPYFSHSNSEKKLPVSISHDGDLVWLVFPLIKS